MFKVIIIVVVAFLNLWVTDGLNEVLPHESPYYFKQSQENNSLNKVNPKVVSIFVAQNNKRS